MLTTFPIILPLAMAALALLVRAPGVRRVLNLAGAALLVPGAGLLLHVVHRDGPRVVTFGDWPAPFGIVFVADLFSAVLVALTAGVALAAALLTLAPNERVSSGTAHFVVPFQVLLAGVNGAFLTGDLFNLYVWFEVLLIASFVLLVTDGKAEQRKATVTYATVNLVASMLFLSGVGLVYGAAGTLNMAALAESDIFAAQGVAAGGAALLLLVAFSVKAAVFPVYSWLPASYHAAPMPVLVLFAALLTKVGVYALIRVFNTAFHVYAEAVTDLMLPVAAITMVSGALGAIAQHELKRLLSFHIISQIGYLVFGFALFTEAALSATLVFLVHVAAAKAALLVIAGIIGHVRGTTDLDRLGGLARSNPVLAALFLIAAFSLAGLPPLSGFISKYALVRAGFEAEAYIMLTVALGASLLTLFSMIKIWNLAFWRPAPENVVYVNNGGMVPRWTYGAAACGLVAMSVIMGLGAELFANTAQAAAAQLIDVTAYANIVYGGLP
ncbi:MAG: proton-conducting transporter membrane subunit [Candidatus Hydrogenedentota bacterium]